MSQKIQTTILRLSKILSKPQKRKSAQVASLLLIGAGFEALGISLMIPILDIIIDDSVNSENLIVRMIIFNFGVLPKETLVIYSLLILISVFVAKGVYLSMLAWVNGKFTYTIKAELIKSLMKVYLNAPYEFHLKNNSAQLIRNLTTEATQFLNYALSPAMSIATETITVVLIFSVLFIMEPIGTVLVVLMLVSSLVAFQKTVGNYSSRLGELRQHADGLVVQKAQEAIGGIKDVKLFDRISFCEEGFGHYITQSSDVSAKQQAISQLPRHYVECIGVVALSTMVVVLTLNVESAKDTVPIIGLFALAAFRLLPSANRLLAATNALSFAEPVLSLIEEQQKLISVHVPTNRLPLNFEKDIEFRKLSYRYPDSADDALSDVALLIKKGGSLGIVGKSGSGKSTFADVLLGLLKPTSGTIFVDGTDIQERLESWQENVAYVQQNIFLTDGTLRSNVAFGVQHSKIDKEQLQRAIYEAQLEGLVSSLPNGIDTHIGERGIRLSGGQRQRIGIARALYRNTPILVFDEATSALDNDTETEITAAIKLLKGSRTIIVIAHRLSTIEHCDRVVEMTGGRISSIREQ